MFPALDVDLLGGGFLDGETSSRLQFGHLVPAIPEHIQGEPTIGIRKIGAQAVQLAGGRVVGTVPDLELGALDGASSDAVHLVHRKRRLFVVLEVRGVVPVGIERHQLAGGVLQPGRGDGLLDDLIHAGKQIFQLRLTGGVRLDLVHAVSVRRLDLENRAGDGLPGVRVPLVDEQVGPLLVLQRDGGSLAGEELHMVLPQVRDVVVRCSGLHDGVYTRLQVGDSNLAVGVCGAVQVVGAILHFCDAEGHAGEAAAIRAGLDEMQGRLDGVGENEFHVLIAVQLNDPLGLVNDVARTLQLCNNIRADRELAQIDLTVLVCNELLGPVVACHRPDAEFGVRDALGGVSGIHLNEVNSGLFGVEKYQRLDAVPGVELHLLGHPIEDVFVIRGHLLDHIGTGLKVRQQNFAQFAGAVVAHQLPIFPDTEGDAGEDLVVAAVVLLDAQAGELLVGEGDGGDLPGHHVHGLDGLQVRFPALDAGNLPHLVGTGGELRELHRAAGLGGAAVGPAGLDVLDLHHDARKALSGVAVLLHPELTEGVVVEGQGGGLALSDGHVLGGILAQKVEFGRDTLINGVVPGDKIRDGDRAVHSGEHPDGVPIGPHHLKDGTVQERQSAGLPLDDLQVARRRRGGRIGCGVRSRVRTGVRGHCRRGPGRRSVRLHGLPGVGVHHVALERAVLPCLLTDCVEHRKVMNSSGEGKLHTAAGGIRGDEELELPGEVGARWGIHTNLRDILVTHVGDSGPRRDRAGVCESYVYPFAVHPGLAFHGVDLLKVVCAIYSNGIGLAFVGRGGEAGILIHSPAHAVREDLFRRRKDSLCRRLVRTARVDFQVGDVPIRQQIAPECHFCGIICLLR